MAKRFTDTEIWDQEWYMSLPCKLKCVINYIHSKCDIAGVWSPNWTLASMQIGEKVNEKEVLSIDAGNKFLKIKNGKIFCQGFVQFQYGETLSEKSPVHLKVLGILEKNKVDYRYPTDRVTDTLLDTLPNTLSSRVQEEEEDIDKEKAEVKEEEKEKKKRKPNLFENAPEFVNPFSDKFVAVWNRWKKYRKEQHNFTYKSKDSEQAAINYLVELSKGSEVQAEKLVNHAILKAWKGFFEIKTEINGTQQATNGADFRKSVNDAFNAMYPD